MYGKFSVGYRVIPEKATVIPQFQLTPIEDECMPTYVNTLTGTTDIVTPIVKSMPVTQASQMPVIPIFLLMKEIYWNQCQMNKQGPHILKNRYRV